jgi:predicted ferric reductase
MLALETPKFVWYLMRGSGLVSFVLLTLTVALGVAGMSRWSSSRWPRSLTVGLHRNVSLLAVCFLAVHVVTALLDSWIGLAWFGALIPFSSSYRPLWVGLGALSLDLLLAVVVTSLLRTHIGHRSWKFVHWSAWLMWPLAAAHAMGSGSDAARGWGLALLVGCLGLLVASGIVRLAVTARAPRPSTTSPPMAPPRRPTVSTDRISRFDPPPTARGRRDSGGHAAAAAHLDLPHQLDPIGDPS